eukprot:1778587-Pleurochrysis_carterae.AAC.1
MQAEGQIEGPPTRALKRCKRGFPSSAACARPSTALTDGRTRRTRETTQRQSALRAATKRA